MADCDKKLRNNGLIAPTCEALSPPAFVPSAECVKLFETSFAKECYAAMGSGGLTKTVGARAGGSGVPFTKRDGLRAYAA